MRVGPMTAERAERPDPRLIARAAVRRRDDREVGQLVMCGLGADEDPDALGACRVRSRSRRARASPRARGTAPSSSARSPVARPRRLEQARLAAQMIDLGAARSGSACADSSSARFSSAWYCVRSSASSLMHARAHLVERQPGEDLVQVVVDALELVGVDRLGGGDDLVRAPGRSWSTSTASSCRSRSRTNSTCSSTSVVRAAASRSPPCASTARRAVGRVAQRACRCRRRRSGSAATARSRSFSGERAHLEQRVDEEAQPRSVGTRPAEVCGCLSRPVSSRSAITLRTVAGDRSIRGGASPCASRPHRRSRRYSWTTACRILRARWFRSDQLIPLLIAA